MSALSLQCMVDLQASGVWGYVYVSECLCYTTRDKLFGLSSNTSEYICDGFVLRSLEREHISYYLCTRNSK